MSVRALPDRDALLIAALRAGLDDAVTVRRLAPDKPIEHLPMITARVITADATRMLEHRTFADVDVQSWASTPTSASELDDLALQALRAAARGLTAGGGRLVRVDTTSLGAEVRDANQPGQLYRWRAGYRLTIRPA